MDNLKYLYFFSASGIFAFGIVPLLWIGSLFVARINRPQIIKGVLFLLMYGHFILYSIISLTIIDAEKSAENTLLVLLEHRWTGFAHPQKVQIGKSSKTERRFCCQNRFADFIVVADCVWLVGIYEAIFSRVRRVSKGKAG